MITVGHAVTALGVGIPGASAGAMLSFPSSTPDLAAGVGALIVATIGLLVVRSLNGFGHDHSSSKRAPRRERYELRKAA